MQPAPIYLEDLSVGDVFNSKTHEIDAQQIKTFALAFDPQPFHLDHAAAAATLFGGLAASGWHTAAITMRLLVASVPVGNGIIGAGGEISWPKPTRPGDMLRVTSTVLDITPSRSKPDRGMVAMRSETRNQHDDVVQVFTSKIVVFRRQADAPG
jgi:acyl dehydratase